MLISSYTKVCLRIGVLDVKSKGDYIVRARTGEKIAHSDLAGFSAEAGHTVAEIGVRTIG
jgi:hypothetical protein